MARTSTLSSLARDACRGDGQRPFHKSVHIHALITSTGATLLFLPPYSPDLNPIEHDFTTLKYLWEYNEQDSLGTIDKMYK